MLYMSQLDGLWISWLLFKIDGDESLALEVILKPVLRTDIAQNEPSFIEYQKVFIPVLTTMNVCVYVPIATIAFIICVGEVFVELQVPIVSSVATYSHLIELVQSQTVDLLSGVPLVGYLPVRALECNKLTIKGTNDVACGPDAISKLTSIG